MAGVEPKMRLKRNIARCRRCGYTVESRHVHDFQRCPCGAIFVDGGLSYRRAGGRPEDFDDLSEWEEREDAQQTA